MQFLGRLDAAEKLSDHIQVNKSENTIILGLPRGGVPLGLVIAKNHDVLFDIVLAKKIVQPEHSELAIGAIAEGGEPMISPQYEIDQVWID